jgi:hypothetical protein
MDRRNKVNVYFLQFYEIAQKPLNIRKAAKQRWFKNFVIKKLPSDWRSNKRPWLTSQSMEEWLGALTVKMKQQNCHILLFLDSVTCHARV